MRTASTLFLITNCSATKRLSAGEPVNLRNWSGTVRQRFRWWRSAVEGRTNLTPARECYAGDAWSQVTTAEKSPRHESKLWIVSAGLGLIPADLRIPNYSATFVNNSPDSVATDRFGKSEWWNLLVEWRRGSSGIGNVSDLAGANPDSVFLIALSSPYIDVLRDDLIAARARLASPENMLIISAGVRNIPDLGDSLLPIDAKFENLVGGARATLNARMLRFIVENSTMKSLTSKKISKSLNVAAPGLAGIRSYKRTLLSDKEVTAFIRKKSKSISRPSASGLLRLLRDEGSACEQKRFHRIFRAFYIK